MAHLEEQQFRLAGPADAKAVANLHADSWRRYYRGAYSDGFLDDDVVADRLAVWSGRAAGARSAPLHPPRRGRRPGRLRQHGLRRRPDVGGAARQPPCCRRAQASGYRLASAGVDGRGRHRAIAKIRSVRVGSRTERRRPGLLRGPRRKLRGAESGIASRRDRQPAHWVASEAAIRLARTHCAARTALSDVGGSFCSRGETCRSRLPTESERPDEWASRCRSGRAPIVSDVAGWTPPWPWRCSSAQVASPDCCASSNSAVCPRSSRRSHSQGMQECHESRDDGSATNGASINPPARWRRRAARPGTFAARWRRQSP